MYRQQRTGSGADRKIKYLTVLAVTVLFVLILVLVTVLIQKIAAGKQARGAAGTDRVLQTVAGNAARRTCQKRNV